MKKISDIIKFLNSIFKKSILLFIEAEDDSITVVIKQDDYVESGIVCSFTEKFYNTLENALYAMGAVETKYKPDELCHFRCYDKNNKLIWKR